MARGDRTDTRHYDTWPEQNQKGHGRDRGRTHGTTGILIHSNPLVAPRASILGADNIVYRLVLTNSLYMFCEHVHPTNEFLRHAVLSAQVMLKQATSQSTDLQWLLSRA